MTFLTPEECSRLALKKHIESLPDWMMDQIKWGLSYLLDPCVSDVNSYNYRDSLFDQEADRLFEHEPYRQGDQ